MPLLPCLVPALWLVLTAGVHRPLAAEPLIAVEPSASSPQDAPLAADGGGDLLLWVRQQSTEDLLQGQVEADRLALLSEGFVSRPPTWMQDAWAVNLADFPTLGDTTAKAERDLRTLEWVIEDQNRQATPKPSRPGDNAPQGENWLRQLLPSAWLPTLKAHRELVVGTGVSMLMLMWLAAAYARRPGSASAPAPTSRAATLTAPMPLRSESTAAGALGRRRRRHR
jgi:hypothetical protein